MSTPGTLVISLDFELMWGMFDKVTIDSYGENLRGVHTVVPTTLELFQSYNIHATWATVGMLMYPDAESLQSNLPTSTPPYQNKALSAHQHISQNSPLLTTCPECYFAPDLVSLITTSPGQELASHTFAHYYCLEAGATDESFTTDCAAMQAAAAQFDTTPTSIVFPRNQWSPAALEAIAAAGLTCYRGTENHFIYQARNETSKTNLFLRGLRFLDRYLNLTGHHTYTAVNRGTDSLCNLPASRQLHPYSKKLAPLEWLKVRRIKAGMTRAAKRGEVFHLWWHPHNFGVNQTKNFALLTSLLEHYKYLEATYGMESKNMQELATPVDALSA